MEKEKSRITQRGGYNREVEWYLTEVSRLMGERSNFGGLVAVIERGGTGGNSGTKGCGIIRVEPFEASGDLSVIHRDFKRARRCEIAWSKLSLEARWVLAARYCYRREKLPHGLHGQLGDLSGVAFVVAALSDANPGPRHKCQIDRLVTGAPKKGSLAWAEVSAEKALKNAHSLWKVCRAHVETMEATAVKNER
jgi:hypothetical protein